MKRTEKIALTAFMIGVVAAIAFVHFIGGGFFAGLLIWALVSAGWYRTSMDYAAKETIIDAKVLQAEAKD